MSLPHLLQSPFKPQPSLAVSCKPHFRVYKRRRLKFVPARPLRCFQNPFQSQFDSLVSSIASQFSPDSILPSAVAFASGVALTVSQRFTGPSGGYRSSRPCDDIGEWILFSSPTPFNRFVLLRCPSLSFEGSELLEDVNERLVKEDRHFVRLSTGKVQVKIGKDDPRGIPSEPKLEYQRACIGMEDGGVISLDWPANLDLKEERGLDSTLLLVPGTTEGSMDEEIKAFVLDALNRGFFPVVMNPRGCAGSPLTTARLFTAADSDDISSAVQYINKARPWTTLMGVGWGFGANMLTKYLAEVGEGTPLTAATCINNPFDLEEATRSFPHHVAISEKLVGGLKDILRANKELFQGKTKGFDVETALSTKSVREFDKAISMVSYEFEAIEEFYSRSSTRDLVGNVKVPLLFIQNDDETVPPFSIPRGKIAENPYTSLLLCLCSPSGRNGNISALSWCRHLTVEWLAAVELGLLKGRHPLLEDIDISINPSKGLSLVESNASNQTTKINKVLGLNEVNEYSMAKMNWMLEDSDITASRPFGTMQDQQRKMGEVNKEFQAVKDRELQQSSSIDAELVEGEEESSMDTEKGEVLQSAEVVMNMLDVTMPGALTEDKKLKVLTAVSQGETVMKAINDAVPEDVRGKMTDAVSGILHAQGAKFKLNKIQGISPLPNLTSTSQSKNEEAIDDGSGSDASSKDNRALDETSKAENSGSEDGSFELGSELPSPGKSADNEETKSTGDAGNSFGSESSGQKASDSAVSFAETASGSDEGMADAHTDSIAGGLDAQKSEEGSSDPLSEEKNMASPKATEDVKSSSTSSSEVPLAETDKNDDLKNENKSMQSVPSSSSSSFSMTEALDALTGMDDSTQVAVNSVFGVLEEMITQLEEGSDDENGDQKDAEDKEVAASPQNHESTHCDAVEVQVLKKEPYLDPHYDAKNGVDGEKLAQLSGRQDDINGVSQRKNILSTRLVNTRDLDGNNIDRLKPVNGIPFYATTKPYGGLLRDEYIRRYLFSKLPTKSLDMDMTAALLLDYIPEEGQWTLLEQPGSNGDSTDSEATMGIGVDVIIQDKSSEGVELTDKFIEAPYIVMDSGEEQPPVREYATKNGMEEQANIDNLGSFQLMLFIRKIILDILKVEVDRRMNVEDKKQMEPSLALDCDLVASAVCSAIGCNEELALDLEGKTFSIERSHEKIGTLHGEIIVGALSSAVQRTDYLKKVLPLGVVVGSCLAALEEFFDVVSAHDTVDLKGDTTDRENISSRSAMEEEVLADKAQNKSQAENNEEEIIHPPYKRSDKSDGLLQNGDCNDEKKETHRNQVMVGVVTAALGTSALLVKQQEMGQADGSVEISSESFNEEGTQDKELGEVSSEKDQTNLVTSLAEKAMSVAAPVVPTKDGEVDQERLVAMLTELGQRGGLLRLVGKVALLWGGLRGAMSFTDKLISFLHIAERPLIQRIVAFVGMVLVLWSPIFVPLLPTLVQSWMSNRPFRIAELACIVGLYAAVIVLVRLWGRRIREYEKPFTQYGLDVISFEKVSDLLKGLVGGVMLILAIQVLNSSIGCISFCWPPGLPSPSLDAIAKLNAYSKIIVLAGQGFATAIAVALVEELLFRSWLPAEIATDLGHHWGTILSGLAFSLLQRPLSAVPGLWLLSLSLSGIRQRNQGSLAIPIGLRAGIIATNYILQTGGFLTSTPNVPLWIIGTHPFQPFSGIVGLSFALLMAVILYPREQTTKKKKLTRPIRE